MNILFLSLLDFDSLEERNIYSDLIREFIKNGHSVTCISPVERRKKQKTHLISLGNSCILKLKIGNTQKVNIFEKGISTLLIERQFKSAIKKHFKDIKFDLVMYATPPITFAGVIQYIKKRDGAKSYLLLKDIFPQNSVDLGMLKKTGLKGLLYRFFRKKEKKLYALSDKIGCMSEANRDYVLRHNPELSPDKVEVCPNSIEYQDLSLATEEKQELRVRYSLPTDKTIFVYGGNLGRPQDVPFIVKCLKACADLEHAHFVVAGSGTDRHFLEEYVAAEAPAHVTLFGHLPKDEYDRMVAGCDVGLIFLDHRFTIPNFPSRLLAYMQAGLPVLSVTDPNTDVGQVAVNGGFGWSCESDNAEKVKQVITDILSLPDNELKARSRRAQEYLLANYTVETSYEMIQNSMK